MKKLLSLLLVLMLAVSMTACAKPADDTVADVGNGEQLATQEPDGAQEEDQVENQEEVNPTEAPEKTKAPKKQATAAPAAKPEKTQEATAAPAAKPEKTPEATVAPTVQPTNTPTEAPAPKTLGNDLLAQFKTLANAGKDVQTIAQELVTSPAILFSGGAMPIEPGLLAGFGNTEITGFTSGATFAPMIGTIPFVGYVFELDASTDVSAFISTLKSNADLRWNICVEADEMVAGSVGNKVFFVMCPTSLE